MDRAGCIIEGLEEGREQSGSTEGDRLRWRPALLGALVLHGTGLLLLLWMVNRWHPLCRRPPAVLDLELARPAPAVKSPEALPMLEQAVASAGAERRESIVPLAASSELPARLPEPEVMTPAVKDDAVRLPPVSPVYAIAGNPPAAQASAPPDAFPSGAGGGRPTALAEIKPYYPYAARTRGEAGKVTILIEVTEQGQVEQARVATSSGYPALDASALEAARHARFKPAEQHGLPVRAEMRLLFDFRLQDA